MSTHTATRWAVLNASGISGRMASTDLDGRYRVLGRVRDLPASVYVVSERTGMVALVTRTGRTVRRDGQTRVRFDFAHDSGGDELTFDGVSCRGMAPADIF